MKIIYLNIVVKPKIQGCLKKTQFTHLWPFSKSKFNLKSDRVNLVAPVSPIECLLYLSNDRAIQYKLGSERLNRLGNSNVQRDLRLICMSKESKLRILLKSYMFSIITSSIGSRAREKSKNVLNICYVTLKCTRLKNKTIEATRSQSCNISYIWPSPSDWWNVFVPEFQQSL